MKLQAASERELLSQKAEAFFEERWRGGDPWDVEDSQLDQESYACQISLLRDARYERVLELGCGGGSFTRKLTEVADWVLALDVAPSAIQRARDLGLDPHRVDFRVANIMDCDPHTEGPWDLVVMSETIYYLGWLYSMFDIGWLAAQLFDATRSGGRYLMANTYGVEKDHLLRPWLIDTYRDLFHNVGYRPQAEKTVTGTKSGVEYDVLVVLLSKPQGAG